MFADIVFTRKQHLGLVTLNRPNALNALTLDMIKALQQQLEAWQNDSSIHAVVAQGEGKAFCAGGDIRWLYESGKAQNPVQMDFFWHEYRLNYFIHQYQKPYIAIMDGMTMGGGVGISLHGSHPVATERFLFAMPETGIGFFPDIGASYLLARCPGKMGIYLGLTGNRLDGAAAKAVGLVKELIPSGRKEALLNCLVETDLSIDAHAVVDACLQKFTTASSPNIPLEQENIDRCFSAQDMEGIIAQLNAKNDEWSQAVLQNLQTKSPLSLKVTLAQIQKAKSLSMADCIKMDYCLVSQFVQDKDFYEGVRALLIDKDKSPHWNPPSLDLVTKARVADYFECRGRGLELN